MTSATLPTIGVLNLHETAPRKGTVRLFGSKLWLIHYKTQMDQGGGRGKNACLTPLATTQRKECQ